MRLTIYIILLLIPIYCKAINNNVTLDFSISNAESWDTQDDGSNQYSDCIRGDKITGFEVLNVKLMTLANGSFFSESVMYMTDSNMGYDDGIKFKVAAGHDTGGIGTFNSNGVLNISDTGLPDLVSLPDKIFIIQFFEDIDDYSNHIDTKYIDGKVKFYGENLYLSNNCVFSIPPDNYENDDTYNQISTFDPNVESYQNRNFSDDSVDFVRRPGIGGVSSQYTSLEFSNLGSNIDICVNKYKKSNGTYINTQCNINPLSLNNNVSIQECELGGRLCYLVDFEIINLKGTGKFTNYTLKYVTDFNIGGNFNKK